jgi:hypothetical protein
MEIEREMESRHGAKDCALEEEIWEVNSVDGKHKGALFARLNSIFGPG